MQLLIEEFFGKILKFVNEIDVIFVRIIIKCIFFILTIFLLFFIVKSFYAGNDYIYWIFGAFGIYILAEAAHYIRKTREREITEMNEVRKPRKLSSSRKISSSS